MSCSLKKNQVWHKVEGAWKAFECKRREILGTTGLASGWSERTSVTGPSELLASLTSPLNKTAAWDLTVKRPFTDQPEKRGFYKLAQHWLVAKALTQTIKDYTRNYAAQDGPSEGTAGMRVLGRAWLSKSQVFGQGRPRILHPHHWIWLPKWSYKGVAIKYGEKQSETMWKWKLTITAMYKTKNTYMYRNVTLRRSFFIYSVIMKYY